VWASLPCLHNALISDDLPTLDLPMNANSGNLLEGFSFTLVELPENTALLIFILWNYAAKVQFYAYICMVTIKKSNIV